MTVCYVTEGQGFEKENPLQIMMHYMPWFKTKEKRHAWGIHWTMKNQDPDTRPNSRLDSPQFTKNSLYNKLDMIFQAKKPGLIELEMMETFRAWIEDQKGDDYHRFQTFEFIFATAVSRTFSIEFH